MHYMIADEDTDIYWHCMLMRTEHIASDSGGRSVVLLLDL